MSFQAYIDNIKTKTGLEPAQFKAAMEKAGVLQFEMKAKTFTDWLSAEFELGHGHCMALWAVFKTHGWVADPKKK
jgi:Domain of unknown function (DUF4287)